VILLQAHVPTPIQNGMEKIVLLVTTANELIAHSVINVEEVVSVFAGVLDKFRRQWSGRAGTVAMIVFCK